MKPSKLLLPAVVILAQATSLADGGTVQLRKEAGDLVITVFTSPAPLSVGPADVSLLLQKRNGLEPVLDANVTLVLRADDSGVELRERPTREQARNKLLYAAPVTLPKPGKWLIAVTVVRNGDEARADGIVEVAPAPDRAASYGGYIAFPPVMMGLFVVRERLIRRKSKR
jgi:hypothetical protein